MQRLYFFKAVNKNPNTVHHATFFEVDPFIKKRAKATVSTFYHAIPELFNSDGTNKYLQIKKDGLKASNFVIAISESSERDMLKFYPFLQGQSTSIHLALELMYNDNSKVIDPLPAKYLLWVGNRQDYKNGLNTLKAFAKIAEHRKSLHFIFCGGTDFSEEETQLIKKYELENKVYLKKNISDRTLENYYKNALALIYTSAYEGFDIPLLEAMQLGCPVVQRKLVAYLKLQQTQHSMLTQTQSPLQRTSSNC